MDIVIRLLLSYEREPMFKKPAHLFKLPFIYNNNKGFSTSYYAHINVIMYYMPFTSIKTTKASTKYGTRIAKV